MVYTYFNPKTGEVRDVVQKMNDPHVFEEGGVKWERVYHSPQVSISLKTSNPFDVKELVGKTYENKKGTIGNILDMAEEARSKRIEKEGFDSWGEQHKARYKKETGQDLKSVSNV